MYTLEDGNIVKDGVSGTTDKEDLKHWFQNFFIQHKYLDSKQRWVKG